MITSIKDYVDHLRIIDGHEHIIPAHDRRKKKGDFFSLLHYLRSDLLTAGMPSTFFSRVMDMEEKVDQFLTYWERTHNTAYAVTLKEAMRDLYGMRDWTKDSLMNVNEQVKQASSDPEWYSKVLKEKAKIDMVFTLIFTTKVDRKLFRPVMFMDETYRLLRRTDVERTAYKAGRDVYTLSDYLQAVDEMMETYVREGMVATKLGHAYWRTLQIDSPAFSEAEQTFNCIMSSHIGEPVSQRESKPLQDFLIHHIIRRSKEAGVPIQIHTGHQEPSVSNNGNDVRNSRVTDLIPLLLSYPEASFVLLHGGFPYWNEYLSIVKNFPNTYADMTWTYIISPTMAAALLRQMIEMVPQAKIFAFGGDYDHVEGAYAHSKLARRVISQVMSEQVSSGSMLEEEAYACAERILRKNLEELYKW
ncbi:amidohydrolase family protein [Alteribacillus sp. HJP-4]|uniref:amidohydrolase family protein n=1 Tax=Alteribacillus sp. HJP-4 TaxID=2775394 RepID=UPI0035CCDED6